MLFAISHFILVSKINDKVTNNYFPEKRKKNKEGKTTGKRRQISIWLNVFAYL